MCSVVGLLPEAWVRPDSWNSDRKTPRSPDGGCGGTPGVPLLAQICTPGTFAGTLARIPNFTLLSHTLNPSWSPLTDLFPSTATISSRLRATWAKTREATALNNNVRAPNSQETSRTFRLGSVLGKRKESRDVCWGKHAV